MFVPSCLGSSHMILTCMRSGTPVLSIRLATLTVFPQISYWGFRAPITPATTGPMFRPEGGDKNQHRITKTVSYFTLNTLNPLIIWVLSSLNYLSSSGSCWRNARWCISSAPSVSWRSRPAPWYENGLPCHRWSRWAQRRPCMWNQWSWSSLAACTSLHWWSDGVKMCRIYI